MNFHNEIAALCLKTFELLSKSGKPRENEWTVLSCIVLEQEAKLEVVALGTGTKCIGQDKLSSDGDILNDSHAEIICRRAFLRFIYEKILNKNQLLFRFNPEESIFYLNENIQFHFFTTHVPCGDAAIFEKQDKCEFGNIIEDSKFPESKKRRQQDLVNSTNKKCKLQTENDIYRTGAKCLASDLNQDLKLTGENYHVLGVVRTKPGRGVQTLSVSCSDKIAKWYQLGVQGALLSIIIKQPIYFSSFTICGDTPFNKDAIKRAFYNRLELSESIIPIDEKAIGQSNLPFIHSKAKGKTPCPSSISWLNLKEPNSTLEVTVDGRRQGVTKKQLKTKGVPKTCRKELFKLFIEVITKYQIVLDVPDLNKLLYRDAKLLSKTYQSNWCRLKKSFKNWSTKHDSLQQFHV